MMAAFLLLALNPAVPLLAAGPPPSTAPIVWPMTIAPAGGTIVLYEPQVRTWPQYREMTGIAAVAVTMTAGAAPAYGTLTFTSLASADVPAGVVSLVNPTIQATTWPTASASDGAALDAFVRANLHVEGKPLLPLAMVLASLPKAQRPKPPVRTNPPVIYMSQHPAVLVQFQGHPAFAPIPGTALTYATNTDWDVVHDPATSLYYLREKDGWYSAPSGAGPFTPTVAPASFAKIPATGAWKNLHAAIKLPKPSGTVVTRVFVSTVPSALILIAGQPQFTDIAGTQLRFVKNTATNLFFDRDTTLWYVLLGGSWFSAANLNGPWTFASANLPADFKKIPEDGPRGSVLASVPGTSQALYAAAEAQVPHVTTADPATASLNVEYTGGAPSFAPVAGTALKYAVNTRTPVIEVDAAQYYALAEGVWFTASTASGPWAPATYVPAVIYTIPASSPLHQVTYVHVYDRHGVAMTAPPTPKPTAVPQPRETYRNLPAKDVSAQVASSYYYSTLAALNTVTYPYGYYGPAYYYGPGYGGVSTQLGYHPAPGNFSDTNYAREMAAYNNTPTGSAPQAQLAVPAHGPRTVPGPNTNVYAADDGVYRSLQSGWEKNAGGDNWTPDPTPPASLAHDRKARLDGYRGGVS